MADGSTLNDRQISEWLASNPDFLGRHPELLDQLEVPHHLGVDSLIELQVARLRRENQKLRVQLETLAGIAGENERLMQRLHQLTLEVMTTGSAGEFIERLMERLSSDFDALSVHLYLLDSHDAVSDIDAVRPIAADHPDWLDTLLENDRIEFGRFTRAKIEFLFPRQHGSVGSAALVPISSIGLLAIGSASAERFHPDMGTLFLELLGTTIRYRLEQDQADLRKRA